MLRKYQYWKVNSKRDFRNTKGDLYTYLSFNNWIYNMLKFTKGGYTMTNQYNYTRRTKNIC